jgi:hypothetical protein
MTRLLFDPIRFDNNWFLEMDAVTRMALILIQCIKHSRGFNTIIQLMITFSIIS